MHGRALKNQADMLCYNFNLFLDLANENNHSIYQAAARKGSSCKKYSLFFLLEGNTRALELATSSSKSAMHSEQNFVSLASRSKHQSCSALLRTGIKEKEKEKI